jgi:hypothetical protein
MNGGPAVIMWREKLRAFGVHFAVTLLVTVAAAALIFVVWFPEPFQDLAGGVRLFVLVTACDLVLGPIMSLVVYSSRKSRTALLIDYTVIGLLQLGALVYGIHNIWEARPVYLVFAKDQIEMISAGELSKEDLAEASSAQFRSLPLWGPRLVATSVPRADRGDALFSALAGKDVALRPKFYVPYDTQLDAVVRTSRPLTDITSKHPALAPMLKEAIRRSGRSEENLRWLSVKHRRGFSTALIDAKTGYPVAYLTADAY